MLFIREECLEESTPAEPHDDTADQTSPHDARSSTPLVGLSLEAALAANLTSWLDGRPCVMLKRTAEDGIGLVASLLKRQRVEHRKSRLRLLRCNKALSDGIFNASLIQIETPPTHKLWLTIHRFLCPFCHINSQDYSNDERCMCGSAVLGIICLAKMDWRVSHLLARSAAVRLLILSLICLDLLSCERGLQQWQSRLSPWHVLYIAHGAPDSLCCIES